MLRRGGCEKCFVGGGERERRVRSCAGAGREGVRGLCVTRVCAIDFRVTRCARDLRENIHGMRESVREKRRSDMSE